MKKTLFILFGCLLCVVINSHAQNGITGNLQWEITDGTLTISGKGKMPDYRGGGFSPWSRYLKSISSVVIKKGVKSIGNNAFYIYPNTSITSVTIPKSVTSIGEMSFRFCSNLSSVTIPNSVISIGNYAFGDCKSLTSVTIPNSVINIGDYAFDNCSGLKSVTIPNSVTSIGYCAFIKCKSLTSITIPNSVISIGDNAFSECNMLYEIKIDENHTTYSSMNGVLFNKDKTTIVAYPCGKTDTTYVIPASVTTIGNGAFSGCSGLTSITLPDSVTMIGYGAFSGCSGLTSITIPNPVTAFSDYAFQSCSSLSSVIIPRSLTIIGHGAFNFCDLLSAIYVDADNKKYASVDGILFDKDTVSLIMYPCGKTNNSYNIPKSVNTIKEYSFSRCLNLNSIIVPDFVTTIEYHAFEFCDSLKSFTIPHSVTTIGDHIFLGCNDLTEIINQSTIPQTIKDDSFFRRYEMCTLRVPAASVDTYRTADGWKNFKNIEAIKEN